MRCCPQAALGTCHHFVAVSSHQKTFNNTTKAQLWSRLLQRGREVGLLPLCAIFPTQNSAGTYEHIMLQCRFALAKGHRGWQKSLLFLCGSGSNQSQITAVLLKEVPQ